MLHKHQAAHLQVELQQLIVYHQQQQQLEHLHVQIIQLLLHKQQQQINQLHHQMEIEEQQFNQELELKGITELIVKFSCNVSIYFYLFRHPDPRCPLVQDNRNPVLLPHANNW
jgi:hypothetical protein